MEPTEIKDEESLSRWLEGQSREHRQAIAIRSAQRVAPIWFRAMVEPWAREGNLTAQPIIRQLIVSSNAGTDVTPAVKFAAASVVAASIAANGSGNPDSLAASVAAIHCIAADSGATSEAGYSAGIFVGGNSNDANRYMVADVSIWEQTRQDVHALLRGENTFTLPLWSIPPPDWFRQADAEGREIWAKESRIWSFWIRWWDGVLSGKQVDWDLQRDVALIPDEDWGKGPEHVAEVIAAIEKLRDSNDGPGDISSEGENTQRTNLDAMNASLILGQLQVLSALVADEINRLRGSNSLPDDEHARRTRRIDLLTGIQQSVAAMQIALEATDENTSTSLAVFHEQLPAVIDAAASFEGEGGDPNVSGSIITMGTTIEYLTKRGAPGSLATGIAVFEFVTAPIAKYLKDRTRRRADKMKSP